MRRVADFIVRNWPLKLGAILLATVLYSGLVLGQNVRTWTGTLPVDPIRQQADAALLSDLDPVTQVRYRAPLDVGVVSPASFSASVDLSRVSVQPDGSAQSVPVSVVALDGRIQVVDFQPREIQVRLDPVSEKQIPVTVTIGTVPEGVSHAPPQIEPATVTIRGPKSRVDFVAEVQARVAIEASALNVDRDIELVAVDSNGNQVSNIEIDPERARVRIAVARELANRTLPVVPQVTGQPAPGYRISSITVAPPIVTVSGEAGAVTQLETALTEPIDIEGRTDDLEATIRIAVPSGVSVSGVDTIRVMIAIDEDVGSRTFFAAVTLVGTQADLSYAVDTSQIQVVATGPLSVVDAIDPASVVASVDVAGLGVGTHIVDFSITPLTGVEVAIQADQPTVVVSSATPSPISSP